MMIVGLVDTVLFAAFVAALVAVPWKIVKWLCKD